MIRRATFADVPGLRRLYAALTAEARAAHPVPYPAHGPDDLDAFTVLAARRVDGDPTCLLYVAEDAGELVGFLGGEISERALGEPRIFCAAHWLYVLPPARGRGLARELVRAGCADLEALGITHVELAALAGDTQWAARGWVPFLVHHALPLAAVVAGVAERPAVDPHDGLGDVGPPPAAPAPPPKPKRRRGRPPKPRLVAGGRA